MLMCVNKGQSSQLGALDLQFPYLASPLCHCSRIFRCQPRWISLFLNSFFSLEVAARASLCLLCPLPFSARLHLRGHLLSEAFLEGLELFTIPLSLFSEHLVRFIRSLCVMK